MEKIDIHDSEKMYSQAIDHLKKDVSPCNFQLIKDFLDASVIGKTVRKGSPRKASGIRARVKNVFLLKVVAKFFDKDLSKMTSKDMERFISSITENRIHKATGQPYSEQTKSNMKITFISFLRYHVKDASKFAELTDWIPTSFKRKEINALEEEDIKKMLGVSVTLQQKALIALLFDTGCRIEEFLNIRVGDITEVKEVIPYYKVTIRNEFSKTHGRTIPLFWKQTTEVLSAWLEVHPDKGNLQAQLYPSTYGGCRKILFKIGKRALGRSINPHLMRHSSATYYAGLGYDYFQICKRYGWEVGSKVPQIYIDRSGIKDKEQTQKFIKTNVSELQQQIDNLQKERAIEKEEREELKKRLEAFEGGKWTEQILNNAVERLREQGLKVVQTAK